VTSIEGVLIVDKPTGPTSHDVVEEVRRFTGGLRVGHTGTLDPLATGVLPLCIGRATRLSRFLIASRKVYEGTIRLGVTTDTYDVDGRSTTESAAPLPKSGTILAAAKTFTGPLMQTPPPYSARKVNGKPMYRLARQGIHVAAAPSSVTVFRFDILGIEGSLIRFEVETSAGTYVRSLAHDLGAALGCGGCLASLRRLASGGLRVEQAHLLDEIRRRGLDGSLRDIVIPLRSMDLGLPSVVVSPDGLAAMRSGRHLSAKDFSPAEGPASGGVPSGPGAPVRVEDADGELVGVALPDSDPRGARILRPDVVLIG